MFSLFTPSIRLQPIHIIAALGSVLLIVVIVILIINTIEKQESFYTNGCPEHYECGEETIDQEKLERSLFSRLRDTEKYTKTPNFGNDQILINYDEAEPQRLMKERSEINSGADDDKRQKDAIDKKMNDIITLRNVRQTLSQSLSI